ncbi:MAG: hypothetical protein ABIB47_06075 [Candidatus Woesearchaeota archaeon]
MVIEKKVFVFFTVFLLGMTLVSAFSFAETFNNFMTGYATNNREPSVTLNAPRDSGAVNNPVTFVWNYFDAEGDELEYSIVQIDDHRGFFSPVNYKVQGESFKIRLDEGGEYWWRVQVVNEFGSKISDANRFFLNTEEKVCSDGTDYFECSRNKPLYCDSGVLKDNCQKCGCDAEGLCQPDGSCLTRRCSEGTVYGSCSNNRPNYCFQGELKEVCSLCGCPEGLDCMTYGKCGVVEEVEEEIIVLEPEKDELTFLEKVASFFKWVFTGKPLYKQAYKFFYFVYK